MFKTKANGKTKRYKQSGTKQRGKMTQLKQITKKLLLDFWASLTHHLGPYTSHIFQIIFCVPQLSIMTIKPAPVEIQRTQRYAKRKIV